MKPFMSQRTPGKKSSHRIVFRSSRFWALQEEQLTDIGAACRSVVAGSRPESSWKGVIVLSPPQQSSVQSQLTKLGCVSVDGAFFKKVDASSASSYCDPCLEATEPRHGHASVLQVKISNKSPLLQFLFNFEDGSITLFFKTAYAGP